MCCARFGGRTPLLLTCSQVMSDGRRKRAWRQTAASLFRNSSSSSDAWSSRPATPRFPRDMSCYPPPTPASVKAPQEGRGPFHVILIPLSEHTRCRRAVSILQRLGRPGRFHKKLGPSWKWEASNGCEKALFRGWRTLPPLQLSTSPVENLERSAASRSAGSAAAEISVGPRTGSLFSAPAADAPGDTASADARQSDLGTGREVAQ